jgi:transcriptional regulator with XRE-family HTH domain
MGIAQNIRDARKARNLTARELAEVAGMTARAVYQIESEEIKEPGITKVAKIAKALNMTIDDLYYGERRDVVSVFREAISGFNLDDEDERDDVIDLITGLKEKLRLTRQIRALQQQKEALDL